jgi:hypothetical protein
MRARVTAGTGFGSGSGTTNKLAISLEYLVQSTRTSDHLPALCSPHRKAQPLPEDF